jgi:hypothetical protein
MGWVDRVNDTVARSRVGKFFQLENSGAKRERRGTKFVTEIRAGLTTFFAMVKIKKTSLDAHLSNNHLTSFIRNRLILFQSMLPLSLTVVETVFVLALKLILSVMWILNTWLVFTNLSWI